MLYRVATSDGNIQRVCNERLFLNEAANVKFSKLVYMYVFHVARFSRGKILQNILTSQ